MCASSIATNLEQSCIGWVQFLPLFGHPVPINVKQRDGNAKIMGQQQVPARLALHGRECKRRKDV